jgi:hypothetical protein
VHQAPTKDLGRDRQSEKESECKNPPRQREVEFLVERAQSTRRKKWEIKAAKRGDQKTKAQDKIPSCCPVGKMLKYWDDSLHTKRKRNKERLNTVVLSGPNNRS